MHAGMNDMAGGAPQKLIHLMGSLEVGGRERVVLDLATRARRAGLDHRLVLFDAPFRPGGQDFDPGGVPWTFIPRGPGFDIGFIRALRRHVRSEPVDVLHAHNDTAIAYAALASLPRRLVHTVGTFHTRPGHDTPRARRVTRWATRRLDGVTSVSDELSELLLELGWSQPSRVIWNGVDLERFRPRAVRSESGPVHVATLARADPIKRTGDLVDAAERAVRAGVDLRLTLAGDGLLRAELEQRAASADWIRVVPRVDDVADFLQDVDVFVLASDHEAAPRALLEAMACGVACVVTEVGGMPRMLRTESAELAGRLVPPRDPAALAAALVDLARDPGARRRLGERARARVTEAYSAEVEWSSYVDLWTSRAGRQSP